MKAAAPGTVRIVGHRGWAERAPENTLASLRAALEAGVDAIEFDVQVAACGTPVLFHDPNLGRTSNGVGPLRRRTLGQLKALDAGKWFGSAFEGERIPSLAEALELVRGREVEVLCEVKGYRELEDLDRMVEIVRGADELGRVRFISLDAGIVDRIDGRDAATRVGTVVEDPARLDGALERVRQSGSGFVNVDERLLLQDPSVASRVLDAGATLGAWTVDEPAQAERLAAMGVTWLTTDRVEALLRWRAGR